MTGVAFSRLDWAVVAAYFVINTAICIRAAMIRETDTSDYFLASRDATWWLIGSSIFASNIGAEHLIGLAGSGAKSGMAFAHWELHSYVVLILGWVFAPFYLRARIFTTPEFLEKRYTPATRIVLSLIFLVSYILTKASVTIFAGAFAIQTILGWETLPGTSINFFWFSALTLVVVTGVFTIIGGMKSVLWTEAMHVPVLLGGSLVLLAVGLVKVGGLGTLLAANEGTRHLWAPLQDAHGATWLPRDFSFLFDTQDAHLPWLGVLLASPIIGLWYWCTDQYIAQRVLTGKNLRESRRGTIFAAYLKLAPVFIFLLPGMVAVALQEQQVRGFEQVGSNPQGAFPMLVSSLLPTGLRGLVLAGMLSALMSALASLFNSTATLFTVDFYKRVRPRSSEAHLVFVGRCATLGVVGVGMLWIPFLEGLWRGSLYGYLQLIGVTRLVRQGTHETMQIDYGILQPFIDMNWLYFSFGLFVFSCALIAMVSLATPKATDEQIAGLTYSSITPAQRDEERASYGFWEIFHTCAVLAIIMGVYIYFW
jgi:SSS family solute:Na+ symporter